MVLWKQVHNNVFLAQGVDLAKEPKAKELDLKEMVQYFPFCDDFGPVRLCEIVRFYYILNQTVEDYPDKKIVISVEEDNKRELTNAIFVLGCFLMIREEKTTEQIVEIFNWVDKSVAVPFRDASFTKVDFGLSLANCWHGFERGMRLGWIKKPKPSNQDMWGKYSIEEYEHYDNCLNGDFHVVVPGKFIAFRGPRDLHGQEYIDINNESRDFDPSYYIPIFDAYDVSTVVRLNEPHYDAAAFTKHGIDHRDLEFEDCTAPPEHIVDAFLRLADRAPGLVAVHCKAGLGRTGTLIAIYMMTAHQFTAREAIAWLRLIRPGSVIGSQQHFLAALERTVHPSPSPLPRALPAAHHATASSRSFSHAHHPPASPPAGPADRLQRVGRSFSVAEPDRHGPGPASRPHRKSSLHDGGDAGRSLSPLLSRSGAAAAAASAAAPPPRHRDSTPNFSSSESFSAGSSAYSQRLPSGAAPGRGPPSAISSSFSSSSSLAAAAAAAAGRDERPRVGLGGGGSGGDVSPASADVMAAQFAEGMRRRDAARAMMMTSGSRAKAIWA